MDGVQKALAGLPGAVFYGAALLLVTAAGALGYTAGGRSPGTIPILSLAWTQVLTAVQAPTALHLTSNATEQYCSQYILSTPYS